MKKLRSWLLLSALLLLAVPALAREPDWHGEAEWHDQMSGWKESKLDEEEKKPVKTDAVGQVLLQGEKLRFVPVLVHHMAWEDWLLTGKVEELKAKLEPGVLTLVRLKGEQTLVKERVPTGRLISPGAHERHYTFAIDEVIWVKPQKQLLALMEARRDAAEKASALLVEKKFADARKVYGSFLLEKEKECREISQSLAEAKKEAQIDTPNWARCTLPDVSGVLADIKVRVAALQGIEALSSDEFARKSIEDKVKTIVESFRAMSRLAEEQKDQRIVKDEVRRLVLSAAPDVGNAILPHMNTLTESLGDYESIALVEMLESIGTKEALVELERLTKRLDTRKAVQTAKEAAERLKKRIGSR